jgi:hypothetical protein
MSEKTTTFRRFDAGTEEVDRIYRSIVPNSQVTNIVCYRGRPGMQKAKRPQQYGSDFRAERADLSTLPTAGPPDCRRLPVDRWNSTINALTTVGLIVQSFIR